MQISLFAIYLQNFLVNLNLVRVLVRLFPVKFFALLRFSLDVVVINLKNSIQNIHKSQSVTTVPNMNSNGRNTGIHELMMSNEGVRRDILSLCSDFHVLNPRFSSFRLNDGSSCTKKLLIAFIGLEKSVKFEERKLQRFGSSARIADRRQGVPSI